METKSCMDAKKGTCKPDEMRKDEAFAPAAFRNDLVVFDKGNYLLRLSDHSGGKDCIWRVKGKDDSFAALSRLTNARPCPGKPSILQLYLVYMKLLVNIAHILSYSDDGAKCCFPLLSIKAYTWFQCDQEWEFMKLQVVAEHVEWNAVVGVLVQVPSEEALASAKGLRAAIAQQHLLGGNVKHWEEKSVPGLGKNDANAVASAAAAAAVNYKPPIAFDKGAYLLRLADLDKKPVKDCVWHVDSESHLRRFNPTKDYPVAVLGTTRIYEWTHRYTSWTHDSGWEYVKLRVVNEWCEKGTVNRVRIVYPYVAVLNAAKRRRSAHLLHP